MREHPEVNPPTPTGPDAEAVAAAPPDGAGPDAADLSADALAMLPAAFAVRHLTALLRDGVLDPARLALLLTDAGEDDTAVAALCRYSPWLRLRVCVDPRPLGPRTRAVLRTSALTWHERLALADRADLTPDLQACCLPAAPAAAADRDADLRVVVRLLQHPHAVVSDLLPYVPAALDCAAPGDPFEAVTALVAARVAAARDTLSWAAVVECVGACLNAPRADVRTFATLHLVPLLAPPDPRQRPAPPRGAPPEAPPEAPPAPASGPAPASPSGPAGRVP